MRCGFARGRDAVVATGAIGNRHRMIESPRKRIVASAAILCGRHMIGGFAWRAHIVVTGSAIAAHIGVRELRCGRKRRRRMTGLAVVRARDMRDGLNRRCDARALGVATVAALRRALEHSVDVTTLARGAAVGAGEFEAGG